MRLRNTYHFQAFVKWLSGDGRFYILPALWVDRMSFAVCTDILLCLGWLKAYAVARLTIKSKSKKVKIIISKKNIEEHN